MRSWIVVALSCVASACAGSAVPQADPGPEDQVPLDVAATDPAAGHDTDAPTPGDPAPGDPASTDLATADPEAGDPAYETPTADDATEEDPDGEDPATDPTGPEEVVQDPGPAAVDCSAIAAHPGWEVCKATTDSCEAVFTSSAGCSAVCAAAGLICGRVWENVDGACQADLTRPELACDPPSGHQSDYCLCVRPDCKPDCAGKACGGDGCGGSCGQCTGTCSSEGQCQCKPLTCASSMLHCGSGHDDTCGGKFSCDGVCPAGLPCVQGYCGWAPKPCAGSTCEAFPGAEGEGRFAKGGRGGDVCHVTTTSNSGAGSLRACADSAAGPRTIVFDVGGIITLDSPLSLDSDQLTLAGETAPGGGIVIRGYQVGVDADDVVIRHVRFRAGDVKKKTCPGSGGGFTEDSLTVSGTRIMLDHVSASWGIDESLSGGSSFQDLTVQWSIVAEGLFQTGLYHGECDDNYAPGGDKGHSMGSLFKPSQGNGSISVHHNLYAHNNNRNPAVGTYETDQTLLADIRNNLIYDCPNMGYTSGASKEVKVNYVGNYGVYGPVSDSSVLFKCETANKVKLHESDNRLDKDKDGKFDGSDLGSSMFSGEWDDSSSPFACEPVATHPSSQVPGLVLGFAGARPWDRDEPDVRIVAGVSTNKGKLVNSPSDVGGWGAVDPGTPVKDGDGDGMPDDWEALYGTDPAKADNNGDLDGDGYTNLEEYLHWAARPR
jgi:hypothetical protein